MKGNELEFYQLVTIVKQLEGWQTSQQDEFVLQFLDHPDVFNANCSDMVRALCVSPILLKSLSLLIFRT